MISKNTIKLINSLKIKKYRQEHNLFLVEGEKSVAELLNSHFDVADIYCLKSWETENHAFLQKNKVEVSIISEDELSKISDLSTPNKVVAIAGIPERAPFQPEDIYDLVIVLDGIRDPGNMGTIIRTADWFGVGSIICSPDCVDVYNPKVIQSTMGSFARIKTYYLELKDFLSRIEGKVPVYGALLHGSKLTDKRFTNPAILIIGNESKGISPDLIPFITDPVFIPPFQALGPSQGHAESLNASVANAIICYEIRKQLSENKF